MPFSRASKCNINIRTDILFGCFVEDVPRRNDFSFEKVKSGVWWGLNIIVVIGWDLGLFKGQLMESFRKILRSHAAHLLTHWIEKKLEKNRMFLML